jgi:anti-sigma B factor antagonist
MQETERPAKPGPADELRLAHHYDCGVTVIEVDGELDAFTCPLLRELLLSLLDRHQRQHLVINMDKAVFIDAAGLGVLVWAWHRLDSEQGKLALASLPPRIRRVFDIAGLTGEVFAIHNSAEQAIDAVKAKS